MGLTHSSSTDTTTAVVDVGLDNPVAVWIDLPIASVKKTLSEGGWVEGDSPIGGIHVSQGMIKFLQVGKQEFNPPASNRPSGAPLGL